MSDEQTQAEFQRVARERGVRGLQLAWHAEYVSASQSGGLAFVDAAPGSADILFDVFGFVRDVLASDGVRVLLTAIGLTGAIARVWGFVFKDRDPLRGVTGRQ